MEVKKLSLRIFERAARLGTCVTPRPRPQRSIFPRHFPRGPGAKKIDLLFREAVRASNRIGTDAASHTYPGFPGRSSGATPAGVRASSAEVTNSSAAAHALFRTSIRNTKLREYLNS
jgi:hypothetical protein